MSDFGYNLEMQAASVVLLGNFNPAIFHPTWFSKTGLMREEDTKDPSLQIVSPEVTVFGSGWLEAEITKGRFVARTKDVSNFDALRDIVVGTFSLLEHTPIFAFGCNLEQHRRMRSEKEWHNVGHYLTPKTIWEPLLENPGMKSVTIFGKRASARSASAQFRVEPSTIADSVAIHVNEHYDCPSEGVAFMTERLGSDWRSFLKYASESINTLLSTFKTLGKS